MSNYINTVGAIQDKFGGYWVELSPAQCLTKAEIVGSGVFNVNGSYGDTECPRMDDVAKKENNTMLLLPGDSFNDTSVYNRRISGGGGWAIYTPPTRHYMDKCYVFDNYTHYVYTTEVNNYLTQGSDFTLEAWVYPQIGAGNSTIFSCDRGSYVLRLNSSNHVQILKDYVSEEATSGQTVQYNYWYHIALVNHGGYLKAYLDGKLVCTSASPTSTYSSPIVLYIGQDIVAARDPNSDTGERFRGYMEQIRVSNTARYTSNFTPPSGPFSNDG